MHPALNDDTLALILLQIIGQYRLRPFLKLSVVTTIYGCDRKADRLEATLALQVKRTSGRSEGCRPVCLSDVTLDMQDAELKSWIREKGLKGDIWGAGETGKKWVDFTDEEIQQEAATYRDVQLGLLRRYIA